MTQVAPAIAVRGLRKSFAVKRKAAGLRASIAALVRPRTESVEAVRGISFTVADGEAVGFIGPNGAGKSTTIKILTGILYPTAGEVEVLGCVPWRERRRLAYQIGTVFGQRPQLWYHLPAVDTFELLGRIYELPPSTIRQRIGVLAEAFDIAHLLETPVRKLSLGQRMRCEVAASLLHAPRLVLLDEPSIGLDVAAKQLLRDAVRRMNELEGVGVLVTSHDAGDIEALCRRVIVINRGQLVYEDKVSALKRRYLTTKQVEVRFAEPVPDDFDVPGAQILKIGAGRYGVKLRVDTAHGDIGRVMSKLAQVGSLADVTVSDPSLEEVIRCIYQDAER